MLRGAAIYIDAPKKTRCIDLKQNISESRLTQTTNRHGEQHVLSVAIKIWSIIITNTIAINAVIRFMYNEIVRHAIVDLGRNEEIGIKPVA